MKEKVKKKLTLNKETVRKLTEAEEPAFMDEAAAGWTLACNSAACGTFTCGVSGVSAGRSLSMA